MKYTPMRNFFIFSLLVSCSQLFADNEERAPRPEAGSHVAPCCNNSEVEALAQQVCKMNADINAQLQEILTLLNTIVEALG